MRRFLVLAVLAAILVGSVAPARAEDPGAGREHIALAAWFLPHGTMYRGYIAYAVQDDTLAPAAGTTGRAFMLSGLCKLKERRSGFSAICEADGYKKAKLTGSELSVDPALRSARLQMGKHWVAWNATDPPQPADSGSESGSESSVYLVHQADIDGRMFGTRLHPGQGKQFAWFASGLRTAMPQFGSTRPGDVVRLVLR